MVNIQDNIFHETLQKLQSDTPPLFGIMTPQHMIEHLTFALSFSNGKLPQRLMIDDRKAKIIRHYTIDTPHEMTPGFKAPMLDDNLVPLIHSDLESAKENLKKEIALFHIYFRSYPDATPVSPVMGELNYKEWIIFHNKHFTHHFKQFGLL